MVAAVYAVRESATHPVNRRIDGVDGVAGYGTPVPMRVALGPQSHDDVDRGRTDTRDLGRRPQEIRSKVARELLHSHLITKASLELVSIANEPEQHIKCFSFGIHPMCVRRNDRNGLTRE